jgi:hypothetical protein
MRTVIVRAGLIVMLLSAAAAPASADATLSFGLQTSSAPHPTIAVAWGRWPGTVGFEVEYAGTVGTATEARPFVGTITVNALVLTPVRIRRARVYALGGFGVYGEQGGGRGSGEVAARDLGVGTRIPIGGALNMRVDYRLFLLGRGDGSPGSPKSRHPRRLSAALSLAF